jgi:hypothetical protein
MRALFFNLTSHLACLTELTAGLVSKFWGICSSFFFYWLKDWQSRGVAFKFILQPPDFFFQLNFNNISFK